jgi:hypothetical protein
MLRQANLATTPSRCRADHRSNESICEQMQLQSIPCVFVDLPISRSVRAVGSSQKHL